MRHVVDRFICVAFNFSDGLSNSGCLSFDFVCDFAVEFFAETLFQPGVFYFLYHPVYFLLFPDQ